MGRHRAVGRGLAPDGTLPNGEMVAGGPDESVLQPEWSPDGVLYFVSDRSGWWNLYRLDGDGASRPFARAKRISAQPQWVFGMSTYAFAGPDRIVCSLFARTASATWRSSICASLSLCRSTCPTPILATCARAGEAVFRAARRPRSPRSFGSTLRPAQTEVLRRSATSQRDSSAISRCRSTIEFPTEGGKTAHAFYYPPTNPDLRGPTGEQPPLVVKCHGGPTARRPACSTSACSFGPAGESACSMSTTAAAPATAANTAIACRTVGRRRRRRLRQRRASSRRAREEPTPSG